MTRFSIVSRRYLSFRNEVNRYTQDGVIYLPGCFSKRWVDVVKCGIQKAFENPSELSEKLTTDGGKSVYFNDLLQWRNIDEFQEYVKYSPAAEIAATFMNEEVCMCYESISLVLWNHRVNLGPVYTVTAKQRNTRRRPRSVNIVIVLTRSIAFRIVPVFISDTK